MFSYIIIENGPMVQILDDTNVIDESGPWESLSSAVAWAQNYVDFKNSGVQEPQV